jgi:tetratricopeptide (TPR) repeat protein
MPNKRLSLLVLLLLLAAALLGWRWIKSRDQASLPKVDLSEAHPRVAAGITAAQDSVRNSPKSGKAWGKLGMVLQAHEYADEATECYEKASKLEADDFRWPYYLAVLKEPHDPEEAQREYHEAVRRAPSVAVLRLRLAELLIRQGELAEAESQLREALTSKPNSGRAKIRLAQVTFRDGQFEQARDWAKKAVENAPGHRICYELLAQIYTRENDLEAAEEELKLAKSAPIQTDAWPDPFLEAVRQQRLDPQWVAFQAKNMIEAGDVGQGIETLMKLVEEHPDDLSFRELLAQAYILYDELDSATELLNEGIRRHPKSAEMHRLRGSVLFLRNEWAAAKDDYEIALQSKPEDAAAHYDLGVCQLKLGKHSDAIDCLREAVRYEPQMINARIELAKLLRQQGKNDLADAELEAARQIAPDHPLVKQALSPPDDESQSPKKNTSPH